MTQKRNEGKFFFLDGQNEFPHLNRPTGLSVKFSFAKKSNNKKILNTKQKVDYFFGEQSLSFEKDFNKITLSIPLTFRKY